MRSSTARANQGRVGSGKGRSSVAERRQKAQPAKGAPRSKVRQPAPAEPSKKDRVLKAAERLFALEGFHGVSMRDIAHASGVKLSLIVYHYGSKKNLYRALFEQRHEVFEERLAKLRAVDGTTPDAVERIVEAFVLPVLRRQATTEGRHYSLLTVREASDPQESSRGIIRDFFDPMAREFVAALQRALPAMSPAYLHWAYLFAVGALVMNSFDERMTRLSGGLYQPGDLATKARFLVAFISAGIRGGPPAPGGEDR